MSKISRMHNVQIPDRTFVILVTMTLAARIFSLQRKMVLKIMMPLK